MITSGGNSETQQAFSLRLQRRNHTFIQYFRGEKLAWKITYEGRERNQHFHLKGTEISMLFPLPYSRLILNSFKMNEFDIQYYVNILNHLQLKIPPSVHSQNKYEMIDSEIVIVMTSQPSIHQHMTTQTSTYYIVLSNSTFYVKCTITFFIRKISHPDIGQIINVQIKIACLILNVREGVDLIGQNMTLKRFRIWVV